MLKIMNIYFGKLNPESYKIVLRILSKHVNNLLVHTSKNIKVWFSPSLSWGPHTGAFSRTI